MVGDGGRGMINGVMVELMYATRFLDNKIHNDEEKNEEKNE